MTTATPGKTADRRWQRLQELFSTAVELPEAERQAFVERETLDDPELREELLGLVACDTGKSTGPLTHALGNALDATTRDRRRALLGKTVGNYKLVSVLGHGGTGTVYLGERSDRQYSAQVAVKIVDGATVQGDLGLRFRAERQILASLNHPNIARLLDAGETTEGQPYLVMEYVHGEPVDRYCDRAQLDVRGRLDLFLEICSAVQYAHQNLIVHRDLKPANILVTAEGSPKLLDFGIAKLLDVGDSAAMLALTRMNDRLLTPEYASPEQILGRTVTTASDVYALGVVLYELLTGLRPYVVPASASQLELERSICVSDPQRPSAAVRRGADADPVDGQPPMLAIASARSLTPDRLQKRLAGDIDAIIMRALRKEPQHRYSSVEQLTADIRRYLTREPVLARQGNWLYYSQRFMRRHAFGVSASAVFVSVVLAFGIVMSVQRERIAHERDHAKQEGERAEQVSEFMVEMFAKADPFANQGLPPNAKDLLDRAARNIESLNTQPAVRARLLYAIGRAYRRQGLPDHAVAFLEDSLRIGDQDHEVTAAQMWQTHTELGVALRDGGKLEEGKNELTRALDIVRNTDGERSAAYAQVLVELGRLELAAGHAADAQKYLMSALPIAREVHGARSSEVAAVLADLAGVYSWLDNLTEAEKAAHLAVEIFHETVPDRHPDKVMANARLAEVLYLKGKVDEAGKLYQGVLEDQRFLYGPTSKHYADTLDSLARIRLAQNELGEAAALTREALKINVEAAKEPTFMIGYLRTSLAYTLSRQGQYGDAEKEVRQALTIYEHTLPSDHMYVASAEYVLGEILLQTHRYADAEAILTASMNRYKRTDSSAWRSGRSASALGEALLRQNKIDDAQKYLEQGFRDLSASKGTSNGADPQSIRNARTRLEHFYADHNQRQKLEELQLAGSEDDPAAKRVRPN
ncbi:MAG TPA: serine/threonine-protein kinase [Steroidobacteraceae bacterium]|jgi:serine/threonine protein kinase/TolA-binding protein